MNKVGIFKKGKGSFGVLNEAVTYNDIFVFDGGTGTVSPPTDSVQLPNGIVSGNGVAWVTGMDYEVTPYIYNINNIQYSTNRRLVTLDASDPVLNRIDVIAATYDSAGNGTIVVLKGVNAPSPVKPSVSATQIEITSITVGAGEVESGVPVVVIYDENIEYVGTTNGTVDFADTDNIFNGSAAVAVTGFTTGDEITFTGDPINPTTFNVLQLMLSSSAKWVNNGEIEVAIYNGVSLVSSWVKIDGDPYNSKRNDVFFESGNPAWQTIVIPIEKFNVTSTIATKLVIRKVDIGTDTFSIDLIRFQGGLPTPIAISGNSVFISDGNFLVFKKAGNKNEYALEIGDLLTGMWSADNEFWQLARYNGGDVDVKGSYTVFAPIELT